MTGMKKKEDLPRVSIIVATLNDERTIEECLRSILKLDYPKQLYEVIVVDGCSEDSTLQIAQKYPIKIFSQPKSAPAAYNYALKKVDSELIGIIDADAKVEREWLKKLTEYFKDPTVAGASGTIETWNGNNVLPRCIGYDLQYRYSRLKNEVNRVATMNLLLRKRVLEEVGGFNEDLPTQYDTDLGFKITQKGYRIIVDPEVKCYHFHRPTLLGYFRQQLRYGQNTSKLYLKTPELIRGDQITDFWMNIQPVLVFSFFLMSGLGLVNTMRWLWWVAGGIMAFMMALYFFSAVKISLRFRDPTALLLVGVYLVRAFAWTLGGMTTVLRFLTRRET